MESLGGSSGQTIRRKGLSWIVGWRQNDVCMCMWVELTVVQHCAQGCPYCFACGSLPGPICDVFVSDLLAFQVAMILLF